MKLTKKYRIIWNRQAEIINDPFFDMSGTETVVGKGRNYFESDNLEEIKQKIKNEALIKIDKNE